MGVLPGAVRREQPPSLGDSPAEPGLAEERAHAPEGRKWKVKERRAGRRWAPPAAAREHRVRGPSGGDAGEQKLRPRLARGGFVPGARVCRGPALRVHCRARC